MPDAKFTEFLSPWFAPPVALREAYGVLVDAHHGWPKERQQHWKRAIGYEVFMASARDTARRRRAKRLEAEAMADDDAVALGDLI